MSLASPTVRRRDRFAVVALATALAGCSGPQSALVPAGRDAALVADLFWWMAAGAVVVWTGVVGLAVYVLHIAPRKTHSDRVAGLLIIGGGAVTPTLVLGGLAVFGLALLPPLLAPAPAGGLAIEVTGEQWWWRVRYPSPAGGDEVEAANELRLPVGRRVDLHLTSPDVVHSLWVPSLGGKVDMVPGRTTRLSLEPTRTGVFRGVCAEYCGASHALMAFDVVVMEEDAFAGWLARQAAPAAAPAGELARRGRDAFLADGCGACHAVRGTSADGVVGPDLTHVGGRRSLAAGSLPNDADAFRRWIAESAHVKPEARMPAFGMLPAARLAALAAYLDGLE